MGVAAASVSLTLGSHRRRSPISSEGADRLEELEPDRSVEIDASGRLELAFGLPMPAISLVELLPVP